MKKHLIAMLLVIALLLTGCGKYEVVSEQDYEPEKQTVKEEEPEEIVEKAEETPEETEPAPAEKAASMGYMDGTTYINEYAGYAIDLSGGWTFTPAEELQELPENVAEKIRDSEIGDKYSAVDNFTDILAENEDLLQTINLVYSKMTVEERLNYALMSEQEILEGILSMQEQMAEAYAQAGILVEDMEIVDVTFLGEARKAILTTSTMQDIPYITLQLFDVSSGKYTLTLTLASFLENTTESMLDLFTKIG